VSLSAHDIRNTAERDAAHLPGLLLRAQHLANGALLGEHGRRRPGSGDDFWQYRPLYDGESHRMIDWRQSARGDDHFVRQHEMKNAQTAQLWVDQGASMRFTGHAERVTKSDRARIIALSLSILLLRNGERVGLSDGTLAPRRGGQQVEHLSHRLETNQTQDYAAPETGALMPNARVVFISDFMAPVEPVKTAVGRATDRNATGVLLQVLDPIELQFPFTGRTIFESIGGKLRHESLKASDLKAGYLERLEIRRASLRDLCQQTGWQYHCHMTDRAAQSALLWLYHALGEGAQRS